MKDPNQEPRVCYIFRCGGHRKVCQEYIAQHGRRTVRRRLRRVMRTPCEYHLSAFARVRQYCTIINMFFDESIF